MFSIVAMILEISSEEPEIRSIALFSSLTCSTLTPSCPPACSTNRPASLAASEVILALEEISVMVAASSWTALACSMEPWLSDWAPVDTWPLALDTWLAEESICRIVPLNFSFRLRIDSRIF